MTTASACWGAPRRRVAGTFVLLLLFLLLLNVTSGIKNREEKDVQRLLQPSSQLFLKKHSRALPSYQRPKAVRKEKFVEVVNHSGSTFIHIKAESRSQLKLSEFSALHNSNGNSDGELERKVDVFHKQSSTPLSAYPDDLLSSEKNHPSLQDVSAAFLWKNLFEISTNAPALKKLGKKSIFLYEPNLNTTSGKFRQVNNLEHERLKERSILNNIVHLNTGDSHSNYKNSESDIPKKNKRSVITLGDAETVQTVDCVNKSTTNSTCGNDGRFNIVPGSNDSSRTAGNLQLNNTFTDRNHKSVKDFSLFSQSRLTMSFQKKKLVDITDSSMGYRSPSTSGPSHKHRSTPGNTNETSAIASRSINMSYSIPNVKPAGRVAATNIALEGLDAASITGITVGSVVFLGIVGAMCFILYKRRNQNKPQTLSDKSSNPDSSVYIEESSDDSEEMYSLDNDSFLNSLEAMTIQNYWTENVKHTKL